MPIIHGVVCGIHMVFGAPTGSRVKACSKHSVASLCLEFRILLVTSVGERDRKVVSQVNLCPKRQKP